MNPLLVAAIAAGGLAGLGMAGLGVHLFGPDRVSLAAALAPVSPPAAYSPPDGAAPQLRERWTRRVQRSVEARLAATALATPDEDLALIEWGRGRFLLARIGGAAVALLGGPLLAALWMVAGTGIPPAVPVGVGVLAAALTWLAVGLWVRDRAAARRLEMREAIVSYLTILALYVAAAQGRVSAMRSAAEASPSWPFRRIAARLAAAARANTSPESAVAELAAQLGMEELSDLADITATAGVHGARVFQTLLARADSLRTQMRSAAEAAEVGKGSRVGIPKAMLIGVAMVFMLYPALSGIAG